VAIPSQIEAMLCMVEAKASLAGRFTSIKRIGPDGGAGQFSFLFTANDSVSNQRVALKFFRPDKRYDGYRWASFQREAEILGQLPKARDFICRLSPIEEFVEIATTIGGFSVPIPFAYYGLELAENDIAAYLASGKVSLIKKMEIFHCMCRTTQRLHTEGISHRDIKASNFLRMPDGTVKICDFGTARRLRPFEAPLGSVYVVPVGDLRYVSPELQIGLHDQYPEISFKGDVFALGATLFELVTGTTLGPLIYTGSMLDGLDRCLSLPTWAARRAKFDEIINELANRNPLPRMDVLSTDLPNDVRPILQGLFQSLCHLDYRKRLTDFSQIFLRTKRCIFVLEHSFKYQSWIQERRRRKAAQTARMGGAVRPQ
jgi:serine/threonine protein kinase